MSDTKIVLPINEKEYRRDCQLMYEQGRADEKRENEQNAYMRGYNQGYDKGYSDGSFLERVKLQKAFNRLHGAEYSWQEVINLANEIKEELKE